jgi:hypothetical protein
MSDYYAVVYSNSFSHHGILGQKWGKRNGPPYPLGGGDYTPAENRAIYRERKLHKNSIYNKKHFDKTVKVGTNFATLSYDKDRTKGADMFYAAYSNADKHQYNALFNKKVPQELYDEKGNNIGTGNFYKYRIQNTARKDVKVASEDSGAKMFMNLYKRDRDFYNFVTDPDRMQSHFVDSKYKFKGYREARDTLEKMREPGYKPTEDDMKKVYRLYNYTIPSDGGGDSRRGGDVAKQRAKFFKELKGNGYGAVLDTNDAIYGAFKAQAPVIVFDMESIALKDAERVTTGSKLYSDMVFAGRKAIGL